MRHDHGNEPLPSRAAERDHAPARPGRHERRRPQPTVAGSATALITAALIVAILAAVV